MKLHADLSLDARVDGSTQPWVASPMPGVDRRMLERDGEEVARVTSIVRYAPGSRFSPHTHSGGEEFLVLEGVFSDEHGDYPAGFYVRNPVGTRHSPHTDPGSVILVKLWWMLPDDQTLVRIDWRENTGWLDHGNGVHIRPLHEYRAEKNQLVRLERGARLGERSLQGGEELFVIEGSVEDENGLHGPQVWIRHVGKRASALRAMEPSLLYVKRGHLDQLPPRPPT
ncbi:MAG TPA: cupin domain-containing protein [Polyangium sp.]|nr:cupin domain-containing protein [Polyangium sp.]